MLSYVGDEQFLQIHMNLLRDNSKTIQLEAFHVFKIFVANPQKPPRVQQILFKNKEKLILLLETFKPSRQDDRQFVEDRNTVIDKLQVLEMPPKAASASAASAAKAAVASADSTNVEAAPTGNAALSDAQAKGHSEAGVDVVDKSIVQDTQAKGVAP